MDITSAANPRIKRLVALRDRKVRERESVFVVEGSRDLARAVAHGHRPLEIYYDPARFPDPPQRAGAEVSVATAALDRASYRGRSQGAIGVFSQFDVTLDHLAPGPEPLFLMAEAIEKPGNLGALLRTADAVGADAVIAADPDTDPFSPNVVRASTGAIFSVPLGVADLDAAVNWVRHHKARIVAADPGTSGLLWDADLTGPLALLVGAEDTGLTESARTAADSIVSLPMRGSTDSLNVSVSMAVLAYEALRQRSA
ncbi:MAG TPA: TrmH family RNA methyltransferase [Acidimicrobiia bacterium]|jgi:TrmH family RNA methyltransferase|nr:TrmH family RNA methyltransferase [Acidimicrobiia bacterium]